MPGKATRHNMLAKAECSRGKVRRYCRSADVMMVYGVGPAIASRTCSTASPCRLNVFAPGGLRPVKHHPVAASLLGKIEGGIRVTL